MFLSIVIPAYNEANYIFKFIKELEKVISTLHFVSRHEIVIVDDHSTDNLFEKVERKAKRDIKIIRLSKRSGSHVALRAGLSLALGDTVLCIAADGQDDPEVIPQMIKKIKEGNNTVWAIRKNRDEPFIQYLLAVVFYRILRLFVNDKNSTVNLANADFYILDRKVVKAINKCEERNTSLFGLILWVGFKQDYIYYERRKRISGKSKWNFTGKFSLAKNWIIAFSGVPLKIASWFGMLVASIGIMYAVFLFFFALLGYSKPGWAETVVLLLILGGVQLMILGIVGEYLWRTLDETRKRPLFFIEKAIEK